MWRSRRSRQHFCYDCLVPFTATPTLDLPYAVKVVTHHAEGKAHSTGAFCLALLLPKHLHSQTFTFQKRPMLVYVQVYTQQSYALTW